MAKSKINLNVEYDLVAVIDGLPEAERKKFDMSVSLTDFLGREGLNQQVAKCNTKGVLFVRSCTFSVARPLARSSASTSFATAIGAAYIFELWGSSSHGASSELSS